MLHSVLAVVAGFAVMAVLVIVGTALAMRLIPPGSGAPAAKYLTANLVLSAVAAVAGGWITGRLAGQGALGHGLALAGLMLVMSVASMRQAGGTQPRWYQMMLLTMMPVLALGGAMLHGASGRAAIDGAAPAIVLGTFADDYGSHFTITDREWTQNARARYHIVRWRTAEQYLIARNDSGNPSDGGLWTRIDWMPLPEMAPYTWGFCMSAYRAPTAAAAESTAIARRETPKTGCNGYPFSRMQPAPETR